MKLSWQAVTRYRAARKGDDARRPDAARGSVREGARPDRAGGAPPLDAPDGPRARAAGRAGAVRRRARGIVRAVRDRCCVGSPVGHHVVPAQCRCSIRLDRAVRGDDRSRIPPAVHRFPVRGTRLHVGRAPPAGRPSQPHGRAAPRAGPGRPPRTVRRSSREPRLRSARALVDRRIDGGGRRTDLSAGAS